MNQKIKNQDMYKTSDTNWNGSRIELFNTAFNTVTGLLRDYPYSGNPEAYDKAEKYRKYTEAMELLGKFTAREFMALFVGYTMMDSDKAFYSYKVRNMIVRFGGSERPLDNIGAGHLLAAIDKLKDSSWGIWSDFYTNLLEVAEYTAKTTGEENIYNVLRLVKEVPDFWKVEKSTGNVHENTKYGKHKIKPKFAQSCSQF